MSSLISRIEELQKELEKFISYKGAKLTYNINNKPPVSFDDFYKNVKRFITSIERLNNSELSSKVSKLDLNIADERLLYELESELVCIFDILEDVLYKKNKQSAIKVNSKNINSLDLKNFFNEMNNELDEIIEANFNYRDEEFDDWRNRIIPKLHGSYRVKTKRISSINYEIYLKLKTILRDMYFKHNINKKKSKINIESEKFLKAREGNIDFELELAKMITGDNTFFPYRSSFYLTEFFQSLGHDFTHNGEIREEWVKERLEELNIKEIHHLLSHGLFKRKYYSEHIDKVNSNMEEQVPIFLPKEEYINIDSFFNQANKEFEKFIKNSIVADKPFDLSNVLDMNLNIELLFDNKATTKDEELNKLIEEAKERFLSNDKMIGVEKLWDAFERFKTHFDNGKKKKQSLEKVLKIISENFDEDFIENEFKNLTKIGNNYRIRHHETDKKELTSKHINYFFFRMMSLIDLCLMYLNEEEV